MNSLKESYDNTTKHLNDIFGDCLEKWTSITNETEKEVLKNKLVDNLQKIIKEYTDKIEVILTREQIDLLLYIQIVNQDVRIGNIVLFWCYETFELSNEQKKKLKTIKEDTIKKIVNSN